MRWSWISNSCVMFAVREHWHCTAHWLSSSGEWVAHELACCNAMQSAGDQQTFHKEETWRLPGAMQPSNPDALIGAFVHVLICGASKCLTVWGTAWFASRWHAIEEAHAQPHMINLIQCEARSDAKYSKFFRDRLVRGPARANENRSM